MCNRNFKNNTISCRDCYIHTQSFVSRTIIFRKYRCYPRNIIQRRPIKNYKTIPRKLSLKNVHKNFQRKIISKTIGVVTYYLLSYTSARLDNKNIFSM